MEPLRQLHFFFLKHANADFSYTEALTLLDELHPGHGIVFISLQYLQTLLRGSSTRVKLLTMQCGCATFMEWVHKFP